LASIYLSKGNLNPKFPILLLDLDYVINIFKLKNNIIIKILPGARVGFIVDVTHPLVVELAYYPFFFHYTP